MRGRGLGSGRLKLVVKPDGSRAYRADWRDAAGRRRRRARVLPRNPLRPHEIRLGWVRGLEPPTSRTTMASEAMSATRT